MTNDRYQLIHGEQPPIEKYVSHDAEIPNADVSNGLIPKPTGNQFLFKFL